MYLILGALASLAKMEFDGPIRVFYFEENIFSEIFAKKLIYIFVQLYQI